MNMRKTLITLLLIPILSSCSMGKLLKEEDPNKQLICDHAAKQKKRYNLNLVASGFSQSKDSSEFEIQYNSCAHIEIPQVRRLFVLSLEEFLNMVNADEELRPRLKSYPITIENMKFNLGFVSVEGEFAEPPYIAYAYLENDHICYCYYDNLFGKFIDYDDVKESYEEALQIVIGESQ